MGVKIWLCLFAVMLMTGCAGSIQEAQDGGDPGDAGAEDGDAAAEDGASPGDDGGIPGDDASVPGDDAGSTDDSPETQLMDSVTDHGVTWTFSESVPVGRFVTGEYYVVGPVTVVSIDPPPGNGRNGSVLNLPPTQDQSPWDDRVEGNRYEESLRVSPPIQMVPGDSLLSSISVEQTGQVENWLREGNGESSGSPVWSISVLNCLDRAVPSDTFRPSYADTSRLYRLSDVNRSLLPKLAPPSQLSDDYLSMFADRLIRPWVDSLFYAFDAQVEYMAMYGREMGRVVSIVSLMLMLDLPTQQQAVQEQLLIGFVQHGIDLWGLATAGYPGWYAHGGHGSGRKWFIMLSGMLLGDARMSAPTQTYPQLKFGEDMHTAFTDDLPYGPAWCGATVVYTGHMGVWNGQPVSDTPGWGPYEHLPPDQWEGDCIGESYRRCCTSIAWVGQALAARLVSAQQNWNHDAFFAYVDRWMDPAGDTGYTQTIYDLTGRDFRGSWAAHGQAWDDFVEEMWAQYR
jgi:hypothetical protein